MGNQKATRPPENAGPGRKLTFLASVCFRGIPSASADAQHMCGRKTDDGEMGKYEKKETEMAQIAETRAGLVKYCFRLLPSVSADAQHMWTEDGKGGNYKDNRPKMV